MRIAISGSSGRMGKMLIKAVNEHPDLTLTVALDSPQSPLMGQDAGALLGIETGVQISHDPSLLKNADCLIDFTRPEATLNYLEHCLKYQTKMVIGTTGLTSEQRQTLEKASHQLAIVFSPNMSIGVNSTFLLLEKAAQLLNDEYDIEIFEAHHKHKVDAPSGTALEMGKVVAQARGVDLNEVADWARHGHTGPREKGHIGFSVVRGGDIVGDHRVMFCGPGEIIEIAHRSNSRDAYASGSLLAACFLKSQSSGLFNMLDVIKAHTSKH
ncbi:4-hydroxy-tetrahydrodipicolinate reductase [Basilea psittacipulmonis]|uniref:4-hydroxy-tetrahydrodipicolinate reductase n=1 Tax=Basilea psittacipulmonis DSM 24701 TaxID=1072685 RepID=A0A077DDW6_9BURK|nr:4-hydroxy-tetrahydrodipicolinate reductase [Basilea psittacipulmonis]AIL33060.1 4-hydroxy-tetrahydrodipicolinate reductase [Basilea psittacipulmonis DSM 24701]